MGYWDDVRKLAVQSALKSASLDTVSGWIKLAVVVGSAALTSWVVSGPSVDLWIKVFGPIAAALLLVLVFFVFETIAIPPKLAVEKDRTIAELRLAALAANEAPDMVKIDGLFRRHFGRLYELRKSQQVNLSNLSARWRMAIKDMKVIFGEEFGEKWERQLSIALNDQMPTPDRLSYFKEMEHVLDATIPTFMSKSVTRETENLNAYVTSRLAAERMEA